jgi:hypothetical protein
MACSLGGSKGNQHDAVDHPLDGRHSDLELTSHIVLDPKLVRDFWSPTGLPVVRQGRGSAAG